MARNARKMPLAAAPFAMMTLTVMTLTAAACTPAPARQVTMTATPASGPAYGDFDITLTGLKPGGRVVITASIGGSISFTSTATFTADHNGRVDAATSAPTAGSYTGAHATGLLWSMKSSLNDLGGFYPSSDDFSVALSATADGHPVASTNVTRVNRAAGVTTRPLTPAHDRVFGTFYQPPEIATKHAAILLFGGSGGGLGQLDAAVAYASSGFPTLALAYFDEPGLPADLRDIPLEYFGTALRVLATEPGVDPGRIFVQGASRGSEAALLLGVHYPGLVHGVIATSPSSVANVSALSADHVAWTWQGKPVPTAPAVDFGDPVPRAAPDSVIPVERIPGAILTVCGTDDKVWPSCDFARAITDRRAAHHLGSADVALREPGAGHWVLDVVPNFTVYPIVQWGGTLEADALARIDAWAAILTFLTR